MQARNLRIFGEVPLVSRPVVMLDAPPPPRTGKLAPVAPLALVDSLDDQVLRILTSSVEVTETVELAFRRKERELGELFATLSVDASQHLHRRLSQPEADDRVAERFNRMTVERRGRLVAFLALARQREARRR